MSQPIYQGPPINENVPWDVRHHLQLIYQKLGIINQAFTLQDAKIAAAAATSTETTTNVTVAGGGSGALTPAPKGVLVGTGRRHCSAFPLYRRGTSSLTMVQEHHQHSSFRLLRVRSTRMRTYRDRQRWGRLWL